MAITVDWQGNLRNITFGASTNYPIYTDGIGGLGMPRVRTSIVDRGYSHGQIGGRERANARRITVPFTLTAATAATAQGYVDDLKAAFAPSDSDIELQLRLPGTPETVMYYFGRPRRSPVVNALLKVGVVEFLGTFDALDPLAYGAEATDLNNTGSFTVTNDGTVASDRCTITVTSNGSGAMTLQNTDAPGDPTITWSSTLSNGTVRVIDLRRHSISTTTGDDKTDELSNTSTRFWSLESGDNALVAANMSDADLTFRPAWY